MDPAAEMMERRYLPCFVIPAFEQSLLPGSIYCVHPTRPHAVLNGFIHCFGRHEYARILGVLEATP